MPSTRLSHPSEYRLRYGQAHQSYILPGDVTGPELSAPLSAASKQNVAHARVTELMISPNLRLFLIPVELFLHFLERPAIVGSRLTP